MPDRQTTEDRATQLLYSIQFKLSHATFLVQNENGLDRCLTYSTTCFMFNSASERQNADGIYISGASPSSPTEREENLTASSL